MRFCLLILLSVSCALFAVGSAAATTAQVPETAETDADWYPFALAGSLDPSSPAKAGPPSDELPAGRRGFVRAEGSEFRFEDGAPAVFWGANVCFNANFPSHEEAELLAERLAFFGYNAVRFHHMDFAFSPKGVFRDVRPLENDVQRKVTSQLNPIQLERLDFFIHQLKLRGIYVNINLLVSRRFTQADGVPDAESLGMAAKPVSLFAPRLIELQKNYARALLDRVNPYTGLRYRDDPAIAMIEITNEHSIFDFWHSDRLNGRLLGGKNDSIPYRYVQMLDDLWNRWLENRRGLPAGSSRIRRPLYKLRSMYSEEKMRDIRDFYIDLERAYYDEMTGFLRQELGFKSLITGTGGYPKPEDVEAQASCDYIDAHAYWDHPHFTGAGWDRNQFKIHARSMLADGKLGMIGDLIAKAPASGPFVVSEWNHCYPNPRAHETPVLMAATAAREGWDGLFQFAFSHGWDKKPEFDQISSYFDTIGNAQQLILSGIAARILKNPVKPDVLAEDGILRVESDAVLGAGGAIRDRWISLGQFKFKSDRDGSVFLYAVDQQPLPQSNRLVLTMIGGIKNTGSGWKNDRFDWGGPPTLTERLVVEGRLDTSARYEIYALDERGGRGLLATVTDRDGNFQLDTASAGAPWFEVVRISDPQTAG